MAYLAEGSWFLAGPLLHEKALRRLHFEDSEVFPQAFQILWLTIPPKPMSPKRNTSTKSNMLACTWIQVLPCCKGSTPNDGEANKHISKITDLVIPKNVIIKKRVGCTHSFSRPGQQIHSDQACLGEKRIENYVREGNNIYSATCLLSPL